MNREPIMIANFIKYLNLLQVLKTVNYMFLDIDNVTKLLVVTFTL